MGGCLSQLHRERVALVARKIDHHILGRGEFEEALFAPFTAEAAVLHAAKGALRCERTIGVHPDDAGADRMDHPHRAVDVLRPYARGETVRRIVADRDRLLLRVEGDDAEDRTEYLLAGEAHIVADISEDGRL